MALLRFVDAAFVLVAGPVMCLFVHHQPMPRWFNQAVAYFQTLMALWGTFSHFASPLPHTTFDQLCAIYFNFWMTP